MKLRTLLFLVGLSILLTGVFFACASSGPAPIGKATGTATGTAAGFEGDVTVTLTMVNGFITDAVVKGDQESPTIGGPAILRAPAIIKKNNAAPVDVIASASITSAAIREATQAAIDKIVAGSK